MASFEDVAKRLVLYDQGVELHEGESVPVQGPGEEVPFGREEPLRLECQAFLEALATRRPPARMVAVAYGCSGCCRRRNAPW
jgi:hypothetical protein